MAEALVDRWRRVRAAVKHHKAEMRRHREALVMAATELRQIEHECREHGISIEVAHEQTRRSSAA